MGGSSGHIGQGHVTRPAPQQRGAEKTAIYSIRANSKPDIGSGQGQPCLQFLQFPYPASQKAHRILTDKTAFIPCTV
jgi:hypothetical protein